MAIAPLVKKYLSVGVLGLTATAAYFQARGTSYLLASWVTPNGDALAASPRKKPNLRALTQSASDSRKSAEPILERNAFDSVTGPLNKAPIEIGDAPSGEDEAVDTSNPLSAPECGDVAVNIVTESTDPLWSLAALRGPGDQSAKLRRVGDDVGDKKVAYIGFNSVEGSPSVWLTGGGSLCQALLFAEKKAAPAAATSSKAKPPSKRPTRGAPKVPKDIADKISKVSETEFNVDRSVVDKILENQAALMKSARIVPGTASAGRVAPLVVRVIAIASGPSRINNTEGADVMYSTNPSKNGLPLCSP